MAGLELADLLRHAKRRAQHNNHIDNNIRVHQLDQTLPMQSMQVQLPFENTSGGFELFNRGVTDLAPELVGWYGAPGIDPSGGTTLFLVGKAFSVNGTQVIAGGRAGQLIAID